MNNTGEGYYNSITGQQYKDNIDIDSGDPHLIYPDNNMFSMFGPVLLPKIYGSNLSSLEIGSSGSIVLTMNDFGVDKGLEIDAPDEQTVTLVHKDDANGKINLKSDTHFNKKLSVDGAATMGSTLAVTKDATLNSTLSVGGVATMKDALSVGGEATMQSTLKVVKAATMEDTLAVTKDATLNSTLSVGGVATMKDSLSVGGAAAFKSTLSVGGEVDLASTLKVTKAATLANTLSIGGATTASGTLSVGNAAIMGSTLEVIKDATLNSTLSVGGVATMKDALSVGGEATMQSTLKVVKAATMEDTLAVTKDATLNSTLSVGGVATMKDALSVGGEATMQSTLKVVKAATMEDTLAVTKDVIFNQSLSVGLDTVMSGKLSVNNTGTFSTQLIVPTSDKRETNFDIGSVQYNSVSEWFEGKTENGWIPFNGVRDGDNDTNIEADVDGQDVDILKFTAKNVHVADMSSSNIQFKVATILEDTLSVSGSAHFQDSVKTLGTMTVAQSTLLQNTLSVNSGAYFKGNIYTNEISAYDSGEVQINNDLKVNGNMEITGTINSLNTTTEEILVEDLKIVLGVHSDSGSNTDTYTSEESGAGFEVDGMPTNVLNSTDSSQLSDKQKLHEKSILWKKGGNANDKGTDELPYTKGIDAADCNDIPYWEAKGGAFRITNAKQNSATGEIQEMSYSFSINKKGQLELHQITTVAGTHVPCKKVATFGMIM